MEKHQGMNFIVVMYIAVGEVQFGIQSMWERLINTHDTVSKTELILCAIVAMSGVHLEKLSRGGKS